VKGTGDGEDAGVLRIDFPGGAGSDRLEPIEWDDWFAKFDESGLRSSTRSTRPTAATARFKLVNRE